VSQPSLSDDRVVAFFDVDETIVRGNSARLYAIEAIRHGELSVWKALKLVGWVALYRFGLMDMRTWIGKAATILAGFDQERLSERSRALFDTSMGDRLDAAVLHRIEDHRQRGHLLVLLTATLRQVVVPLFERLDFDAILSNELIEDNGVLTGRIIEPLCFGEGKVVHARQFLQSVAGTLENSYFYSDSIADLPMLEVVGHPVVVNPDPELSTIARQRGWPCLGDPASEDSQLVLSAPDPPSA